MSTTGHETEAINVQGLKASLKKGGNKGIFNEAICSTASATAAKVTNTTPPSFSLVSGAKIIVKFTYGISAENATLQVGSTAAKPIYFRGTALEPDVVKAGTSLFLHYDGTAYNIIGGLGEKLEAGDGIDITNNEVSVDSSVVRKDTVTEPVVLPDFAVGTYLGICSTEADTAAKTATVEGYELQRKSVICITFTNGISVAGATLNISNKGAKAIYFRGAALGANVVGAGDIVTLVYNGTQFEATNIERGKQEVVFDPVTKGVIYPNNFPVTFDPTTKGLVFG